jgi:EAL domain-containing protein (putative c-di-GMP-specific phosphodiesterase class I)
LLAAAGCDFAQGFLFSKPVPQDDFERMLTGALNTTRHSGK